MQVYFKKQEIASFGLQVIINAKLTIFQETEKKSGAAAQVLSKYLMLAEMEDPSW